MTRSFIRGFVVGILLLVVAGVGASRLLKQDAQKEAAEKEYQVAIVDATPVQLGVLTEKQRSHSQLYRGYKQMTGGAKISELIAQAQNRVLQMEFFPGLVPEPDSETPESYFGKLARASDAVIRGRVIKKTSQVTEDDSFVFTDYEVVLSEVLKNNTLSPLASPAVITITRPGGKIVSNGIVFEVKEDSFSPLPITDHDVVLFLKFLPDTDSYQATDSTASFEIDGSTLKPLTGLAFPAGVLRDGNSFLQTTRLASTK